MAASPRARAAAPAVKHWGRKHRCAECGTAFYDMERTPIACPKCGAEHVPTVALPSDGKRARKGAERPAPVAKPTPGVEEAAEEEEVEEIEADVEAEEGEEEEGAVPTLETGDEEEIDPSDDDAIKNAER